MGTARCRTIGRGVHKILSQNSILEAECENQVSQFNDLQTPKLSNKQLCDRTLMLPESTTTHQNRIYKATDGRSE